MASPAEPRVTGNIVAALAGNQSDPTYVASRLTVPYDLVQAILHAAGKALLLLG